MPEVFFRIDLEKARSRKERAFFIPTPAVNKAYARIIGRR